MVKQNFKRTFALLFTILILSSVILPVSAYGTDIQVPGNPWNHTMLYAEDEPINPNLIIIYLAGNGASGQKIEDLDVFAEMEHPVKYHREGLLELPDDAVFICPQEYMDGEFYFYNDIFEEMIHAIASSAPDARIILAGHAEGADTVYAIASRGNEYIDGYVFLSTSDFDKDDLPNMKNVFIAYGKDKSENYRSIFRKLFKTNILRWKYARESTITEEKTNNAYIVGDWTAESTPLVLTEDFFWEWVFNIIPTTVETK